jgi:endonuclease/exonuclease/phosphatase family metal-dependent hydrolase
MSAPGRSQARIRPEVLREEDSPSARGSTAVKIATWNVHGSVGSDRRHDVSRIVAVLHELDADVIALQEVTPLCLEEGILRHARDNLGMHVVPGRTRSRRNADFGNAILSRFPVERSASIDLTVARREPRNALDVRLSVNGSALRVVATHLGLRPAERREQVQRILRAFDDAPLGPAVVLGDVNEWYLWGRPLRWLHDRFAIAHAPATFPARRPMLKLDRIWGHPAGALSEVKAHRSATARIASDHLPLVASFELG